MSRIVNLYKFKRDNIVYTYTNISHSLWHNGELYVPETIKRSNIEQNNEQSRSTLSIKLPRDNPLGAAFIAEAQDWPVSITLYEQKGGVITVIWVGSISAHIASGSEVSLDCINAIASQARFGLRARYQKTCRHALYKEGCNLTASDWDYAGVCTSIDGTTVVVPEAANLTDGDLTSGMLEYSGVKKYIRKHVGDILILMHPFHILAKEVAINGPASITLYEGCSHSLTVCNLKFNNLNNFGGMPWLPTKNPFSLSSIV